MKTENLDEYFSDEKDKLAKIRPVWHFDFIKDNLKENSSIVDVGCGNGNLLKLFKENKFNDLYGIDINHYPLKGIIRKEADLNNIKINKVLLNKKFDVVCCCEVLEHLFDPVEKIKELGKMVTPGGLLLVTLPLDTSLPVRLKILFGKRFQNPFSVGSHIKFFKNEDALNLVSLLKDFKLIKSKNIGLGYGRLDHIFLFPLLAKLNKNLFSSGIIILLRKNSS